LRSLLQCHYPPDRWELILADGMSTDNTREEVTRVAAEALVPILLLENTRRVTPFALNLMLAHARGEIIIRVDAHAAYGADYITRCVEVLQERGADNVGGIMEALPGAPTPMGQAIALAMMHPFGVGNGKMRVGKIAEEVDTVPFGCFRVEVFKRIGLFDERMVRNQDYELNQRIRRTGGRIFLDPRLEVRYYSRPTLPALLRQSWSNGFWNALCHRLHPYSICARHVAPLVFTLGALLALVTAGMAAGHDLPPWGWPAAVLLWSAYAAYLLTDLWVATQLARRHGWHLWPLLLIVFPTFHFINGAGLTLGWVRALLHWYPWLPSDHCPSWEEQRQVVDERMAA
jgi:hypothetical protein